MLPAPSPALCPKDTGKPCLGLHLSILWGVPMHPPKREVWEPQTSLPKQKV